MPKFVSRPEHYYLFPLGLTYVSAALKSKGYSVECLNLNHYEVPPSVLISRTIIDKQIDVLCTGGLSAHYGRVKEILDIARRTKPSIVTVLGGGLLSSEPDLMMNALAASFGVIGEGEETIVELAQALSTSEDHARVKGLIYRDSNGVLTKTPPRPPIQDIDTIPYPDYEGFEIEKYLDMRLPNDERDQSPFDNPRQLCVVSSRSCPYSCTFCYHPIGKKYRQRSIDSLVAELEHWIKKYRVNMFLIMDELFSIDREKIVAFCARIKPLNVKWQIQMRVDSHIDKDTLDMMREAGCYCISYGLESGNDRVLKSMRKLINVGQIVQALETTYDANIGVQGNFLFGDTAETLGTAAETFELWLKLRKHNIWMVPVEVYPGTQLYLQAVSTGLIKDKLKFIERGCPSVNLTQMSERDYLQVLFLMHLLRNSYQIIPAQVLDCKQDGSHPLRGTLYVVTVKCPHCHHTVEYRNMSLNGYRKLGCRECNRRLDLPPLDQYSVWPPNYKLASEYSFSESHAEEIRQFLNPRNRSWLVAEGVALEGSTARFNIIRFFGKHYLVPQSLSPDDIRGHRVSIFTVDINSGEVRQCLDV